MILIGIDPGVSTGFAMTTNGVYTELNTYDFWGAIDRIKLFWRESELQGCGFRIYIEDPNINKSVFIKKGANARGYMRIAQNVGSNKRDAQLIIEYCQKQGIPYTAIAPLRGPMHKPNADTFFKLTGCKGRISQHERDAAMLILGRRN